MKVSPDQLLPSQDFLKPDTIRFIFDCIDKSEFDQLPPEPIVRLDRNGDLIAIDGHNLIAVRLHRHEDIEVHIAADADDGLPPVSASNIRRNADLKEKFDSVIAERKRLHQIGIDTFHDLMSHYRDLF